MDKFYKTRLEEQETIINIDYLASKVNLYTCQKTIYDRLVKKVGKPNRIYYANKKISGGSWQIPFEDKKNITHILSRPTLIGQRK